MTIYFGLGLDDDFHLQAKVEGGIYYAGAKRLLRYLETLYGLQGYPSDNEHLRIEQYRQALTQHLGQHSHPFYERSFEADQLATATELLARRDELKLANWDFKLKKDMPERLQVLAELEASITVDYDLQQPNERYLSLGYADRMVQVLDTAAKRKNQLEEIRLIEPFAILPTYFQRLFEQLKQLGTTIKQLPTPVVEGDSDLALFQQKLLSDEFTTKKDLKADGSLIILKAKRETDIATYLAKLLRKNPSMQPYILTVEKNRTLDNAFIQEGLPCMGILTASSARPMLQIIKLAPAFVWEPIDPFKIMEFVTLNIKPLEEELSNRIARQLAATPGIGGEDWNTTIRSYFDELNVATIDDPNIDVGEIRFQYNFWFNRNRYKTSQRVPIDDIIEIYQYLGNWAYQQFVGTGERNGSLMVLSEQAKRIQELLEAQPEQSLSFLELERVVRTIYEPSPVLFREQEVGFYPFVHHIAAFIKPVEQLAWWNFVQLEPNHFFSKWYQHERNYLKQKNILLETPQEENARLIWHRKQPALNTQKQLILLMPENIEGQTAHLHPLHSDLQATFKTLSSITIDLDELDTQSTFRHLVLPSYHPLEMQQLGKPKAFLHIPELMTYLKEDHETYSSLDTLLYYPYQWVFRYKTRLIKSSILSLVKDNTLLGNLAHRFFERLLKENILNWSKVQVNNWIDNQAKYMFGQEGAVLLMYGREPDKVNFLNRLKYAAWSLVASIQNNGWQVKDTELNIDGEFMSKELRAKADLVLQREDEIAVVDLKWRGAGYREAMIKNQEDLQLVLYSRLVDKPENWAHTAYFIIERGKMIARNNKAFREVNPIDAECNHAVIHDKIISRIEATYQWRATQIQKGLIEVRCSKTQHDIEDLLEQYGIPTDAMSLLEMKSKDAKFDDYKVLINLLS